MTLEDFIDCVSAMRNAQRQYFKTRRPEWLSKSKDLERQVDGIIARAKNPQGDLFAGKDTGREA